MVNHNTLRRSRTASLLLIASLGVAGCGSNEKVTDSSPATEIQSSEAPEITLPDPVGGAIFEMDDLGGGSPIIMTYPGTTESAEDTRYNGTYNHGEQLPIYCQETGRLVTSDTSVSEEFRQSDQWYLVDFEGDNARYATEVYGQIALGEGVVIPDCNGVWPPAR